MNREPTFNQILKQKNSPNRHGTMAEPTVLVESPNGRWITPGTLETRSRRVHVIEDGVHINYLKVPAEKLTDEHQEMLAAKLVGVALGGSEHEASEQIDVAASETAQQIKAVEDAIDELNQSMLESDRIPAWQFAISRHGYEVNNAASKLSPEGHAKARRYKELMDQLSELRSRVA